MRERSGTPAKELSGHPQTEASGMVLHDGRFQTIASPLRADGERLALRLRPPSLGEHSRTVLAELGYETSKIDALIADGVVGSSKISEPGRCL